MRLSIMGLGYVGAVSAGCFAKDGHCVIGVDTNRTKVDLINQGKSPIVEKEIESIIAKEVSSGRLRATTNISEAVMNSDLSLICVGTPSKENGSLDLTYVGRVCEEIGAVLAEKKGFHIVIIRSTVLPGTMHGFVIPLLEETSGKMAGVDFGVCNNPEFLREGTAVFDFYNPAKTIIGQTDEYTGEKVSGLYKNIAAPMVHTSVSTAEMVKYTDNVWHALKVCFANEVGDICKELKIDGHEVMDIFCKDKKLNLSSYYMKPGFAFGGSCLPKDVRALTYKGRTLDLTLPLLNSIPLSNEQQVQRGLNMVMSKGHRKVGVLGFSFKAGTDDLRESPVVELIERLIGKGYKLKLYDRNVNIASISGANRDYIINRIPHISCLMSNSMDDVIHHGDTILIGNKDPEFTDIMNHLREDQVVVDLVRIANIKGGYENYDGICW